MKYHTLLVSVFVAAAAHLGTLPARCESKPETAAVKKAQETVDLKISGMT